MKYNDDGEIKDIIVKAGDTLPLGTVVAYDGDEIPPGYEEVPDYSTDEVCIGVWIDGSPLYRKVVDLGNLPNTNVKTVAHNISGLKRMIKIDGMAFQDLLQAQLPLNWHNGSNWITTYVDRGNIAVRTSSDKSNYTGYAILTYLKN